ncbi:MAG: PASTA domain-containing protein [Paludibacteraceae bacterium]|nr:PASTA domain-containing protein [Paludibacteraceae bacterium]MDD6747843.1 PASTA domain-containing protein [Paludibacteraceae bacterium]
MGKKNIFDKSDAIFLGINILLAIVVVVIILVSLIAYLKSYTQHGVEVEVSNVRGLAKEDAEAVLDQQGLRLVVIDSTYSEKVPFGTIVEQDPMPDSHAKLGRAVYVTVNASGKRQIPMPNLQDMSYRQAETTLRGLGLIVDTIYDYEPSAFRDLVLDVKAHGQSVQPGEKIAVGTKVRLVVGFGRGTEEVEVPSVIGMSPVDARRVLLSHRLTVGAVTCDEAVEEDGTPLFVYQQIPAAGEKLIEGETVALKLTMDPEKAATGTLSNEPEEDNWF